MSAGESGVASAGDEPANASAGRRQGLRLALILLAAFMVVLDFSIVNVALPSIERELGMTAAAAQWVITGYAIAFAGCSSSVAARQTCSVAAACSSSACWPSPPPRCPAAWLTIQCCSSHPASSRAPAPPWSRLPRCR